MVVVQMSIQEIIAEYLQVSKRYEELCDQLAKYYMPRANAITEESEARNLLNECPDHITRVFMIDNFIQRGVIKR